MAGITDTGFTAKTIEEIKADLEQEQLENIDASLVLSADQPIGQLNAAFARQCAQVWEVAQVAYNAFDRDAAEGRLLDNIGSITGTPREDERKSLVECTLVFSSAFTQAPGTMTANVTDEPTILFTNRDEVTIASAGTLTEVVFESVEAGPVVANAGTLETITASLSGWTSITNPEDAVPGALVEEDADYRQRQDDELTAAGSSTVDAIRADILKVDGVEQCYVFENVTMFTDDTGLPGKAIEVVIYDGASPAADDDEIAQAIWDAKPSGVETYGTDSGTAVDDLDIDRTMGFSRAEVEEIYLEFDIDANAQLFPVDGATLVKEAVAARGNLLNLGDDVIALVIKAAALAIPGVRDVVEMRLGLSASPTNEANLSISGRSIAKFDTARIVVNLV